MRLDLRNPKWIIPTIVLLLLLRLSIQIMLYQTGFIALTADDFGRTVVAAKWSKQPEMYWHGVWLPFHAYLFGTALAFKWELLWIPRLITLFTGSAAIVFMYLLAASLFNSPFVGLLSACILTINPAHLWLSGGPLTEVPTATLVFIAVWSFGLDLENPKGRYLYTAACALTLANGFRFESWFISLLFSLILLARGFIGYSKQRTPLRATLPTVMAAALPWLPPFAWIIGSYVATGNPFAFLDGIKAYKLQWYGDNKSYSNYIAPFLKIDPYLTWFGLIAIMVCWYLHRKAKALQWYIAATLIPFASYIFLHGGQLEPPGNYIRYLAMYVFLFYPALGYLLIMTLKAIPAKKLQRSLLILCLVLVATTQISTAFHFVNDPAADGLAVGLTIRTLRAQDPALAQRPVMIELSYWQYLAIHVGANDMDRIVYDRILDIDLRKTQSLLLTNDRLFQACLKSYNISYVIVKDAQLRTVLEDTLQLHAANTVNGYGFYPVSEAYLKTVPNNQTLTCPLPVGSGY